MTDLTLVSYDLCPYVQRAAIVLLEKGVAFERVNVDLSNRPDWFKAMSPLGKVPLLKVGNDVLFESAVIVEYLEETRAPAMHPADPLKKAQHRAWMEFGSSILADIWVVETTRDGLAFDKAIESLSAKFSRLESVLGDGPYFDGSGFTIVDAVFAPVFRYFDVIDGIADLGLFAHRPKLGEWRRALARRPSVKAAVVDDYNDRLLAFLKNRDGILMHRQLAA